MALVAVKWVRVKMLPFDNKSEFQVIVDMPEGTTLEQTDRVTQPRGRDPHATRGDDLPDVRRHRGPYNFNGLVRHYFLRQGSNVADIQVNLVDKGERKAQSHAIAKRVRDRHSAHRRALGRTYQGGRGAPGAPRCSKPWSPRSTGPTTNATSRSPGRSATRFKQTAGVVDVDWYVEDRPAQGTRSSLTRKRRRSSGVSEAEIVRAVRLALGGRARRAAARRAREGGRAYRPRLDRATRSDLGPHAERSADRSGWQPGKHGRAGSSERSTEDKSIYHKNLMPVVYVTADVAGVIESPVYAILKLGPELSTRMLQEAMPSSSTRRLSRSDRPLTP